MLGWCSGYHVPLTFIRHEGPEQSGVRSPLRVIFCFALPCLLIKVSMFDACFSIDQAFTSLSIDSAMVAG